MKLTSDDFVNPAVDPSRAFVSNLIDEDTQKAMLLDPSLLGATGIGATKLVVEYALNDVLRQQQYLVYDISTRLGVLAPYVGVARNALQLSAVAIDSLKQQTVAGQAAITAIGLCGQALSAVPTIYTQIAGAVISLGARIAQLIAGHPFEYPPGLIPSQEFSKATDQDVFSGGVAYSGEQVLGVRTVTATYDWSPIFAPRFRGQLSMQDRHDAQGRHVWAWALGNGVVPRVVGYSKKYAWSPQELDKGPEGIFTPTQAIGMIPGGQRIYSVYQSTLLEQGELSHQNLTVGDARCSSGVQKVQSIDVGAFYPTAAQASMTLWDFMFQRGASMYTVNTYELAQKWSEYFNAIWSGSAEYYSNFEYVGADGKHGDYGWGMAPWDESIANLLRNHGVGLHNEIDGAFTWDPYLSRERPCDPLTDGDRAVFWNGSVLSNIILPALSKLQYAQTWHLDHTTIAAYLPVVGGVHAEPLDQDESGVMGAFKGNSLGAQSMRERFKAARERVLNSAEKYEVRLDDVLDPVYRQQLEAAGGGTQGFGIAAKPAKAVVVWTPTGGTGVGPQRVGPLSRYDIAVGNVAAEVGFIAAGSIVAGSLAWVFRDDLRAVYESVARMLRSKGRR